MTKRNQTINEKNNSLSIITLSHIDEDRPTMTTEERRNVRLHLAGGYKIDFSKLGNK